MRGSNTIERLAFENKNSFYVTIAPPKKNITRAVMFFFCRVTGLKSATFAQYGTDKRVQSDNRNKEARLQALSFERKRESRAEHRSAKFKQRVTGSIPVASTTQNLKRTPFVRTVLGFFFFLLGFVPAFLSN